MSEPPRNELDFERVVTISYNRDRTGLVVEPESVPVHLGLRERVRWVTAVPNARLEIEWKDRVNPFRDFASGGAQAVSGEAGPVPGGERTPRGTTRYYYTVSLVDGKSRVSRDPDVEVYP